MRYVATLTSRFDVLAKAFGVNLKKASGSDEGRGGGGGGVAGCGDGAHEVHQEQKPNPFGVTLKKAAVKTEKLENGIRSWHFCVKATHAKMCGDCACVFINA